VYFRGFLVKEKQRLDLIRKIESKRGSRVIAYISGTRPGHGASMHDADVRVLEHHLDEIFRKNRPSKLDLYLYTYGGAAEVPTAIVALFREYLGPKGEFSVLIPSSAYSAGTIVSLGADEIVMGPGGHIGPIDMQFGHTPIDVVHDYFDLARSLGLTTRSNIRDIFLRLTEEVHPLSLGEIQRSLKEGKRSAMRVLSTRRRPMSTKSNKKIIKFLTNEVGHHGQAIHRSEAKSNGIDFVKNAESFGIRDFMSQLFSAYENLLDLDVPLPRRTDLLDSESPGVRRGDESDVDAMGAYTMEKPLSLVESRDRLDVAKLAYGMRFWRDAPSAPAQRSPVDMGSVTAHSLRGSPGSAGKSGSSDARAVGSDEMRLNWSTVRRAEDDS
jgi:hypothetical protein